MTKKKRSKTVRPIIRNLENINQAAAASCKSFDEIVEHLGRVGNILINRTMITHIEKEGIHCELHQTLNGFMLKVNFNPFKNLKFIETMEKYFQIVGVESEHEIRGYNAIIFKAGEYKQESILDKIQAVLEECFFS
jgi:hypothetical protein